MLKKFEHEKFLFHYTTSERAFENILPSGRLLMSPFEQMRDPLENKRWTFFAAGFVTDPRSWDISYARFNHIANGILKQARLLSFTTDAKMETEDGHRQTAGLGWSSASMWERYADEHRGVCLAFNKDLLAAAVCESLVTQELPPPYYKSVVYTTSGPKPKRPGEAELEGEVTLQRVAEHIEENHLDYFYTKARDWEYEREYRFVVTQPDAIDGNVFVDFGNSLEAVITGESFPTWQRSAVVEATKCHGADALQIIWDFAGSRLRRFE